MQLDKIESRKLALICPTCKAEDVVKAGKSRKGEQRFLCKPCGRRFLMNGALPGRRVPIEQVGDALSMFHEGMSYRDIQRNFQQKYGFTPSTATVYEWVRDFTQQGKKLTHSFKVRTGDTWVADEMVLKIDGKNVWLWNVMDLKSRYLLATHISRTRTISDAETLFSKARARVSRPPERIITDGLSAYREGIERVFGGNTKHALSEGLRSRTLNNNIAERLHGTIRERNKVMRGLETTTTARLVVDGFMLYYNHMRPHSSLRGKTPAEAAKLAVTFDNWIEIARLSDDEIERRQRQLKDRMFRENMPRERPLRVRMLRDRTLNRRRF